MAEKLAEAKLVLSLDDRALKEGLAKVPGEAQKAATAVKSISQAVDLKIFKELADVTFAAFGKIISGIEELGNRGAQVDDVANSFSVLTEKTGESADVMLGKLREGVVGTLSDYDLMVLANKTLGSGLVKTSDDMGALAAGARTLAKATGETTAQAFDTLTSAMASGRTAALKQVGLFVDSKVALEDYSQAIHKNVSDFTDADRAQALAAASLAALRQRMKDIVPDAADFGELIDQAKVRLSNFKDQVAVGVSQSPVFAAGMKTMGRALGDAFGTDNKAQAAEMVRIIEKVAIGATYVAQGVVALGTVFATVFSAIGVVVNGTMTTLAVFVTGVAAGVEALAKLAAAVPGTGAGMDALANSAHDARERMVEMSASLAESTAESARGVMGHSALQQKLDAVGGVIMRVRDAMVAAKGSTAETTNAVVELGKSAPEAAARTKDSATKIADAFSALYADVLTATKIGLEKRLYEIEFARQKEIDGLKNLKEMTVAEHDEMERLINQKYDQRRAAAILAGDEIVNKEREVQNEIALLNTTGTANKLLQIQIARDKEIEALAFLKLANETRYQEDVAAVNEKYRIQAEQARGYYATIEQAATAAGFKTREEMQLEADNAKRLYDEMLTSGKFTYQELEKAKKKATDAAAAMDKVETLGALQKFDIIASSASTILRSLFGKNKNAAIAAAIIDTAAAVAKTLAQYPFPFSLVPAAAAAAAGYAQVKAIREVNPAGFAEGTPGLDFANFGPESWHPLHNQEAVIPRGGGHLLAGEIASAMPGQDEQTSLLREIRALLQDAPRENRKAFRDAMLLA